MGAEARYGRHWRLERGEGDLATLVLDREGRGVNTLSTEVLDELDGILEGLSEEPPRALLLRSGKPGGFIAGADVSEFEALDGVATALVHIRRGQGILDRLEGLGIPTVALIHGFCLGGGLELALACRHRVASDAPETRLGLPEVNLGIHPGFGGTVRLTRLLGSLPALDLMLSGRSVSARSALRMGLVDAVVPERHLRAAALDRLRAGTPPHRPGFLKRLPGWGPLRPLLGRLLRRKVSARAERAHYPAPHALLDLWVAEGGHPRSGFEAEARSEAKLFMGAPARNLVRVFRLQERLKALGRGTGTEPRALHVVGGGVMGGDIAAWCALQGLQVTVQDVDPGRLSRVLQRAGDLYRRKLKDPRRVREALDRLIPDPSGAGVGRADVVLEAIFEDLAAKRALYRELEPRMKPGALLATNTSSLPLEALTPGLAHPERFVGLHFFNPVAKMQLVEVVTLEGTDPGAAARAMALAGAIRRLPLPVRSGPGFLVNRILFPYLMEGLLLEGEGIFPSEIDRAATSFGMPMGPVLLADTVGLDICLSVARNLGLEGSQEGLRSLEARVAAGHLGRKSGQGFYRYRKGRPLLPRVPGHSPDPQVLQRLLMRFLNEAVACLHEGVTLDADLLDAGMVFGTGFAPFRGGPLQHCRQEGVPRLLESLAALEARFGPRFRPGPGWERL